MNKFELYRRAVQDPDATLDLIESCCRRYRLKPERLGEDFCGTFALSCAWVESGLDRKAIAVDANLTPVHYGMRHYYSELTAHQQRRLKVLQSDVRHRRLPRVDVLCALNFSYFVFKQRSQLLDYFKNCRRRLRGQGLLILDLFGGPETLAPNCNRLDLANFTYFWEQVSFDPLTHHARFYIHFRLTGKARQNRAFTYDWRLWSIPEVCDLLTEAGFKKTSISKKELGANAWFAHLTALKG